MKHGFQLKKKKIIILILVKKKKEYNYNVFKIDNIKQNIYS